MTRRLKTLCFRLLAVALPIYWGLLFYSTHQPVGVPDWFDQFDKVIHFGAYAVLTGCITLLLALRSTLHFRIGVWVWTIAFAYGAFDEYTQKFIPDRQPDKLDLLADCLGAAAGILTAFALVHLWRYLRRTALHNVAPASGLECRAS
jgi:VanZ family protein